jgi:hypothetical protein
MLIVKVVDDILVCGPPDEIQAFYKDLSRTYKLNPLRTRSRVRISGMDIVTDNASSTTIDVAHYLAACSDIPLSAERRKQQDDECTPDERTAFLNLCRKLSYLGAVVMPQASFAASHLQQRLAYLRVSDLCEANVIMRNLRSLKAEIRFQNPSFIARVSMLAYSDAAHSSIYGQGGYLAGLCIHQLNGTMLYFITDWHSASLKRVAFFSIGAEILAAANAADFGLALTDIVRQFASAPKKALFELTLDSRGTFDTLATLHEGRYFRLRPTVCRLRDAFSSGDINKLRWAPGLKNITDALTKRNYAMFSLLNNICVTSILPHHKIEREVKYDSKTLRRSESCSLLVCLPQNILFGICRPCNWLVQFYTNLYKIVYSARH